jgi:hypothetical protein
MGNFQPETRSGGSVSILQKILAMFRKPALTWIVLTSLLISVSNGNPVQAREIPIPEGTQWIEPIEGQVVDVQTTGNSTKISLDFVLRGCIDRLLPLITSTEQRNGQVRIYITALNARRALPNNLTVDCYRLPTVTEQIQIPGRHRRQNIQIIFLKSQPS